MGVQWRCRVAALSPLRWIRRTRRRRFVGAVLSRHLFPSPLERTRGWVQTRSTYVRWLVRQTNRRTGGWPTSRRSVGLRLIRNPDYLPAQPLPASRLAPSCRRVVATIARSPSFFRSIRESPPRATSPRTRECALHLSLLRGASLRARHKRGRRQRYSGRICVARLWLPATCVKVDVRRRDPRVIEGKIVPSKVQKRPGNSGEFWSSRCSMFHVGFINVWPPRSSRKKCVNSKYTVPVACWFKYRRNVRNSLIDTRWILMFILIYTTSNHNYVELRPILFSVRRLSEIIRIYAVDENDRSDTLFIRRSHIMTLPERLLPCASAIRISTSPCIGGVHADIRVVCFDTNATALVEFLLPYMHVNARIVWCARLYLRL